MLVLLNLENEVNIIQPNLVEKLGFFIKLIDVEAQKIDNIILNTYGLVIAGFLVINKANQIKFFKEFFLMTNISLEVVFRMFFYLKWC